MVDDLKFKHPFSSLLSGPSVSGKASFCVRFLQNLKALFTVPDFVDGIILCYSVSSTIPYQHFAVKENVRFHGVQADFNNSGEKHCLIIIDDLQTTPIQRTM